MYSFYNFSTISYFLPEYFQEDNHLKINVNLTVETDYKFQFSYTIKMQILDLKTYIKQTM